MGQTGLQPGVWRPHAIAPARHRDGPAVDCIRSGAPARPTLGSDGVCRVYQLDGCGEDRIMYVRPLLYLMEIEVLMVIFVVTIC